MLQANDIYELAQNQDIILTFDTNILVRKGFFKLCQQIQGFNIQRKDLGQPTQIRLCVSTAAHMDVLLDLGQSKGDEYDLKVARRHLEECGIIVLDFTQADAEHCAKMLVDRYKISSQWHAFKKRRCLECLGLPTNSTVEGTGQRCGATIDWLIIAQAHHRGLILVTEDAGPEFAELPNIIRYGEVQIALQQLTKGLIPTNNQN